MIMFMHTDQDIADRFARAVRSAGYRLADPVVTTDITQPWFSTTPLRFIQAVVDYPRHYRRDRFAFWNDTQVIPNITSWMLRQELTIARPGERVRLGRSNDGGDYIEIAGLMWYLNP